MPIYTLSEDIIFPPIHLAEDGILAIGGDLSVDRLLLAYRSGIFPWFNPEDPIIWHAPNPRFVIFPDKFKVSKSLKQVIRKKNYTCTMDNDFEGVIKNCRQIKRNDQELESWITNEMEDAFIKLHKLGFAHSVEVYNKKNELVGGLYGIKLGQVFCGESMFSIESNTSKLAMLHLISNVKLEVIDTQMHNPHLESLGGEFIHIDEFVDILQAYQY